MTLPLVRTTIIPPVLIGFCLLKKHPFGLETLQIIELPLYVMVRSFHITVGIGCGRWNELVPGAKPVNSMDKTTIVVNSCTRKFTTTVGLYRYLSQINTVCLQMPQKPGNVNTGICLTHTPSKTEKQSPRLHVPGRILIPGQLVPVHLRPVMRNVSQILHIHHNLLKRPVTGFHLSEIVLLVVSLSPGLYQTVVTKYTGYSPL